MDVVEIARAMYEAPAPDETEGAVWPPGHPGDVAWWMSRAAAVMPLVRRAQAEALRDAAEWKREHNLGNSVWGDYLQQLAEEKYLAGGDDMITIWLDDRADRTEQEVEHD